MAITLNRWRCLKFPPPRCKQDVVVHFCPRSIENETNTCRDGRVQNGAKTQQKNATNTPAMKGSSHQWQRAHRCEVKMCCVIVRLEFWGTSSTFPAELAPPRLQTHSSVYFWDKQLGIWLRWALSGPAGLLPGILAAAAAAGLTAFIWRPQVLQAEPCWYTLELRDCNKVLGHK